MDKFQVAELLANLHNRLREIESKFNIKNNREVDLDLLWLENSRLALGIDDAKVELNGKESK